MGEIHGKGPIALEGIIAETQLRKRNPEKVQANILKVALAEFAAKGLSGARIDEIAEKTKTSKRMIYYYFGDKLGLYQTVLEEAYREVREAENALELDHLQPVDAMVKLVAFTFDHHVSHPDFIRLVMIENIHQAENLAQLESIQKLNNAAIEELEKLCRRGTKLGQFREDLDPLMLHWQISAFSFFNVSNQPTFSNLFGDALYQPNGQKRLRQNCINMILRFVLLPENSNEQKNELGAENDKS